MDKKKVLTPIIFVAALILAVTLIFFAPSWIRGIKAALSVREFIPSQSYITDSETSIKYYPLSRSVEALDGGELYGRIDGLSLHLLPHMDKYENGPSFLAVWENGEPAVVYRAESEEEITFKSFAPESAHIYMGEANTPVDFLNSEKDVKCLEDAINSLLNGDKTDIPLNIRNETKRNIKFASEKYKGILYSVSFFTDVNGTSYLYDSGEGKCVKCPDTVTVRLS